MKIRITLAALVLALSTHSVANELDRNDERYVADAMEIVTLPTGEVVTRLVSRNGITARQFWVDSVYQARDSLLVYDTQIGTTQTTRVLPREPALTAGRYEGAHLSFTDWLRRNTGARE